MIVKITDFYYDTDMSEADAKIYIEACLKEHILDAEELDLEHFLDLIEESENIESAPDENDCNIEYSLDALEALTEEILEENPQAEAADDDEDESAYDDEEE